MNKLLTWAQVERKMYDLWAKVVWETKSTDWNLFIDWSMEEDEPFRYDPI